MVPFARWTIAIALGAAVPAQAAAPAVTLRPLVTGLESPVEIAHAGDGSGRLFVNELAGRIRVIRNGQLLPQPFLDIRSRVSVAAERGLLGLAFDPQYRHNGRFFVMYTGLPDDAVGGALRVSSFRVSSSDPDVADPASERVVIEIPHPGAANHNGGKIAFAYGKLHLATGDGGFGGDPPNNAQNPASLLGKIVRLFVAADDSVRADGAFRDVPGGRAEVHLAGLRNPWRFGFDRRTGDLYIGDVGQGEVEEIDFLPEAESRAGRFNFGWRVLEGNNCFNPASPGCEALVPDYRAPILTYLHDAQGGLAVTGGTVYRGSRSPRLQGYYLYSDFFSTHIWAARRENGAWVTTVVSEPPNASGIAAIGEDEDGELYVVGLFDGAVYALEGPVEGVAPRNVALASRGATATSSSDYSSGFAARYAIDGDRVGGPWGAGSGWNDGTIHTWPDTLQVTFGAVHSIDRVVAYSLTSATEPFEPFEATGCAFALQDFDVLARVAGSWRTVGVIRGNSLCRREVSFPAVDADAVALSVLMAGGGYSHVVELEAWTARGAEAQRVNFALDSNGGVASASSTYSGGFPPSAAINGDRAGRNWGAGSGWNDATYATYPDWLQVRFAGPAAVDEVVVYSLQDDVFNPVEPTDGMTFTRWGLADFTVEAWDGAAWVPVATVRGNNLVKRRVTFPAFVTDRVRVSVTRALDVYSHVTELEAFGTSASYANWAAASRGGTASASSTYSPGFPAAAAIDGIRASNDWGAGEGWNDATYATYPDWLQVDLAAPRVVDKVVVYSLQDNARAQVEPDDAMPFTRWGIVDFTVEGWNGVAWVSLAAVTGNNLVKRSVSFAPFSTSRIRVTVTRALDVYSHITELEVFGF